jgi:hypothetical protein
MMDGSSGSVKPACDICKAKAEIDTNNGADSLITVTDKGTKERVGHCDLVDQDASGDRVKMACVQVKKCQASAWIAFTVKKGVWVMNRRRSSNPKRRQRFGNMFNMNPRPGDINGGSSGYGEHVFVEDCGAWEWAEIEFYDKPPWKGGKNIGSIELKVSCKNCDGSPANSDLDPELTPSSIAPPVVDNSDVWHMGSKKRRE